MNLKSIWIGKILNINRCSLKCRMAILRKIPWLFKIVQITIILVQICLMILLIKAKYFKTLHHSQVLLSLIKMTLEQAMAILTINLKVFLLITLFRSCQLTLLEYFHHYIQVPMILLNNRHIKNC